MVKSGTSFRTRDEVVHHRRAEARDFIRAAKEAEDENRASVRVSKRTFLYVISPPTPTLRWPIFLSRSDLFLDTPTGIALLLVVPCCTTELCKNNRRCIARRRTWASNYRRELPGAIRCVHTSATRLNRRDAPADAARRVTRDRMSRLHVDRTCVAECIV